MKERIIVSMTSYGPRLANIPGVLNSIYAQTRQPDLVVLNLAYDEKLPDDVQKYIEEHCVEINRVPDTKVYKKLIPTLKKYPEDCIITIDDDFLYPQGMIEEFMSVHFKYPGFPISGNSAVLWGFQCHCGCASLTKAEYIGEYLDYIDEEVIRNCASDDIVYTYFSNRNGRPYLRTTGQYGANMTPFNEGVGYSEGVEAVNGITNTYRYLTDRFGKLTRNFTPYTKNDTFANVLSDIVESYRNIGIMEGKEIVYSTKTFRTGKFLFTPLKWFSNMWHH